MSKRILSVMLILVVCLTLVPLSAASGAVNVTATYADGAVSVAGEGFTNDISYIIRVVDTANSNIKAMGQAVADGSGIISASIPTGALGILTNYVVYVNNPDGTSAGVDTTIDSEGMTNIQKVAADKAALVESLIKGNNTDLNNVTTNLNLVTSIQGGPGSSISWTSSNTNYVAVNGTVTRPVQGDATVTLTATITNGSASDTKQFTVIVKQKLFTASIQAGTGGTIAMGTSGSYAAGATITLEATANSGYTFSNWAASAGTFANANNSSTTFVMPAANTVITANFTQVVEPGQTDVQKVAADKAALVESLIKGSNTNLNNVTANLNLISSITNGKGSSITWASSNTGCVAANGTVTRPTAGDATVTLTATITNGSASDTKQFTVVVKQKLFTATIQAGTGGTITAGTSGSYAAGASITLEASASSGYSFSNWTASAGTFTNANNASTTFVMPAADTVITANFTYNGGQGQLPTPTPTPTPTATPTPAPANVVAVTASVDAEGKASANVAAADLHAAVGNASGGKVKIEVQVEKDTKEVVVGIPVEVLKDIDKKQVDSIAIDTGVCTVSIDTAMLKDISENASAQLQLSVAKVDVSELPEETRQLVGNSEVYDFNLSVDGNTISKFEGNKVSVAVNYTLKPGENPHNVVVYYINDSGELEIVRNGKYNAATGKVEFKVNHFSKYTAMSNNVSFADIGKVSWAVESIEALAARGAINGKGNGQFAPDSNITRAEFIKILMQTLDLSEDGVESTLSDVRKGEWYYSSIAAAQKLGITQGKGDGSFGINDLITRQDMAVMIYRVAKLVNADLSQTTEAIQFKDNAEIANYAIDAVQVTQKAGIINGVGDSKFASRSFATRAQAAAVIYRLFNLIK